MTFSSMAEDLAASDASPVAEADSCPAMNVSPVAEDLAARVASPVARAAFIAANSCGGTRRLEMDVLAKAEHLAAPNASLIAKAASIAANSPCTRFPASG